MDNYVKLPYNYDKFKHLLVMNQLFTSSERINRETGANPVRSRHCDRESVNNYVTGFSGENLGRRPRMMILSQETCL